MQITVAENGGTAPDIGIGGKACVEHARETANAHDEGYVAPAFARFLQDHVRSKVVLGGVANDPAFHGLITALIDLHFP